VKRQTCGFSLVETCIAVLILASVGVPVLSLFTQSSSAITRTDSRREARYYLQEIVAHSTRQSLHTLWSYFGPRGYDLPGKITLEGGELLELSPSGVSGQMADEIAVLDPETGLPASPADNPLGFTDEFLKSLARDGYQGKVHFEFFTRKELGLAPLDRAKPLKKDKASPYGILHMQAGWLQVQLLDIRADGAPKIAAQWKQPLMCPAIVGRGGLKLSSCPAIAPQVRKAFAPIVADAEESRGI
jgi:hypothetical protein